VRADELVVAGVPIARLLPPEVIASGKARATRDLMVLVIIAALVLAVAATGGSYLFAQRAQAQLDVVDAQNASVAAQESKYAPVRTVQAHVKLAQAAQHVGAASEIDWNRYFGEVAAAMPPRVVITGITGETASPTTAVSQESAPLSSSRAATVVVTIAAPTADSVADTLDALQQLPGYTGAMPASITQGASTGTSPGSWTTTITVSLTAGAFADQGGEGSH